ncbi:energy-coupling factor transporter transmembrane component T family protein [Brevibacillus fluminis]|nr:energy-coupling factor transporter transmembrane component T [Brevibacillus fluminis]
MDYEFAYSFKNPQLTGNWLLDLNPLSKLNMIVVFAILPIIAHTWQVNVTMILCYFLLAAAAGRFVQFAKTYLRFGLLIGSLLFLMRALFLPGEVTLFRFWIVNITQEGVHTGIWFSSLVVAICGAILLYQSVTRAKDFMYALEKLGAPRATSYVILSSLQSIIDLGKMAGVIMESQKARGIETDGTMFTRMKAFVPILAPLFLGAISNTEEKAVSMDARAFSQPIKNTHLCHLRPVPVWEKLMVIVVDLSFIGYIVWRVVA